MAQRFGRAGGGNWSAAGTWSATSGGASDGAGINTGDDVVLDVNSTGTFTIDNTFSIATMDCTNFTGTLSHSAFVLTITGLTFKLVSGMTYAPSSARQITFTSTSGTTAITSGSKTVPNFTFNGTGGTFQLQDNLTVNTSSTFTLTAGTFDQNGKDVSTPNFTCNGSGTRAWTSSTGTMTIPTGPLACGGTSLTVTLTGTHTITMTGSLTTNRTIDFGTSHSYNTINIANSGNNTNTTDFTATTAATVATLNVTAPMVIRLNNSANMTITNAVNFAGTAFNNAIQIEPTSGQTPTITLSAAGTAAWCVIGGVVFAGSTLTAINSIDMKGNSGTVSISGPSGGAVSVIGS